MTALKEFWKNVEHYQDAIVGKTGIAEQDFKILKNANLLVGRDDWIHGSNRFNFDLPPEPFVGDLNADIYIITLNPGAGSNEYENWQNETLLKLHQDCLRQNKTEYPFYYLNPLLADTGGGMYWHKEKFAGLITALTEVFGSKQTAIKKIAQNVCDLELCAYRSSVWNVGKFDVSGLFVVQLMRRFIIDVVVPGVIRGDKTLLVGRGREWFANTRFDYNGKIIKFDDLETLFPDRVVFYRGQQCRKMSFTPYGYTKSGGGGTAGGQLLLDKLKDL